MEWALYLATYLDNPTECTSPTQYYECSTQSLVKIFLTAGNSSAFLDSTWHFCFKNNTVVDTNVQKEWSTTLPISKTRLFWNENLRREVGGRKMSIEQGKFCFLKLSVSWNKNTQQKCTGLNQTLLFYWKQL